MKAVHALSNASLNLKAIEHARCCPSSQIITPPPSNKPQFMPSPCLYSMNTDCCASERHSFHRYTPTLQLPSSKASPCHLTLTFANLHTLYPYAQAPAFSLAKQATILILSASNCCVLSILKCTSLMMKVQTSSQNL